MRVLSVSEVQSLEKAADANGHSYAQMMELAGRSVTRAIIERVPVKNHRVTVLVGPGNNGGDGLVAARYLTEAGATVTAYLTRPRSSEEDKVFRQAVAQGVTIVDATSDTNYGELRRVISSCHILVDSLLGIGSKPPLRGTIATLLPLVQEVLKDRNHGPLTSLGALQKRKTPPRPFIVAVDGPSGMDFDTGESAPEILRAHLTVTFAHPKMGHFKLPAAAYTGELVIADIGIPTSIQVEGTGLEVATPELIRAWLPSRQLDAHKGTFGRALITAGSVNYTGAAILATKSAMRAGLGLATVGAIEAIHIPLITQVPEATMLILPGTMGVLNRRAAESIIKEFDSYQAVLIGPGLTNTQPAKDFIHTLLNPKKVDKRIGFVDNADTAEEIKYPPLVIDADALNILSEMPDWKKQLPRDCILTPHPGEMARLTGLEKAEIQAHRVAIASQYAVEWGQVVVLKGAFTVIAGPQGDTMLLPFANPGLATAGTGDVLAGIITALRAQGLGAFEAAGAGAYIHGLAGELARKSYGEVGMIASDVIQALPEALNQLA